MVELRQEFPDGGPVVTGFTSNGFKIGTERFDDGLILTPEQHCAWHSPDIKALAAAELDAWLNIAPTPEFLLLGTGSQLVHPPRSFVAELEGRGLGVEIMDSRAAARCWGVLRNEGRWIVAALIGI